MAVIDTKTIRFGLADIKVTGPNDEVINFDGVDELQAEGGEITLTPQTEDVVIADYGTSPFDQRLVGWEGSVIIRAARQTQRVIKAAMSAVDEIIDSTSSEAVALADSPIGTSFRERGVKIEIFPRNMEEAEAMAEFQKITVFKMAANGDFNLGYGNEQSNIEINYNMYPKDGADPKKAGNYFAFGDATALDTTTTT